MQRAGTEPRAGDLNSSRANPVNPHETRARSIGARGREMAFSTLLSTPVVSLAQRGNHGEGICRERQPNQEY